MKMAKVAPDLGRVRSYDPVAAGLAARSSTPPAAQAMRSMTETLLEIGAKGGLGKRSAKRGAGNEV